MPPKPRTPAVRAISNALQVTGGIAALGLAACPTPNTVLEGSRPVVQLVPVDGSTLAASRAVITVQDLRAARARLRFEREATLDAKPLPEALEQHVLDGLIEERLFAIEADRLGVSVSTVAVDLEFDRLTSGYSEQERTETLLRAYQTAEDLKAALASRLLKSTVLERTAFRNLSVSEQDLKTAWEALPDKDKMEPERVHAAQILVESEEDALAIRRALRMGRNFHELARRFSVGPEAASGGDLGWFAKKEMPTVFDTLCFPLRRGQVSEVATSQFGYHLCKVLERKPAKPLTFEGARERLTTELIEEKRRRAEEEFRAELEARFRIDRDETVLGTLRRNPT